MAGSLGFGIAGAVDHSIAADLATKAQEFGFSTYWVNDTPDGEGLASLAAVAAVTATIQLGVGVIPVDRQPPEAIAQRVGELGLPQERLIVGIGSGGLVSGAREEVREAAVELRELLSATIVVGALGPRMCEVGGESADGVLLNWLTPSYLPVLAQITRNAASKAGRPDPWIGAYVRVALDGLAIGRLREEAARYASYPQYAAHFERMGVAAIETCVSGVASELSGKLAAFANVDETVVRAIAADESYDAYFALLRATAPSESSKS
jgi:alkanesulfonate monooxygenase SsuD/methylene tetrahydromethanopterin reductase-like flavin-dependent oxidoreductase (luciferase family)